MASHLTGAESAPDKCDAMEKTPLPESFQLINWLICSVLDRHAVENSRGASKNCIERNTFPHKFKHIPREKTENEKDDKKDEKKDEDLQVDKCTICLCGKFYLSS